MAETVLVTGATGFVGGWCAAELLRRGYAVRAAARDRSKERAVRVAVARAGAPLDGLTVVAADLTRDAGWDAAVVGCDFVMHVASPLGPDAPRDRDALVGPACDGTLRVLRAATRAGVRRVVTTSAAAAARTPAGSDRVSDETVWADPDDRRFDAYRRSKVLAERAAWDYVAATSDAPELTTILPGAVFGPVLASDRRGSVEVIARLLDGRMRAIPRLGFWVVDVRDLADLHVRAMTEPAALGERFLAAGDFVWTEEIASTLRSALGPRASKVPTSVLPDVLVRFVALFMPELRTLTPDLGRRNEITTEKARRMLGFAPRPVADTIVECAESLLTRRVE